MYAAPARLRMPNPPAEYGEELESFGAVPTDLASYKERVAIVARALAQEHGWCSVVDQALATINADTAIDMGELLASATESAREDAYDAGREAGYESGYDDGASAAKDELPDVTPLVDALTREHNDSHVGAMRYCAHEACRLADEVG